MTPETLNPEPSPRTIAAAQLRMITLLQKRDFLVLGAIAAVLVGLMIWGQIEMGADYDGTDNVPIFRGLTLPLALVGMFWPIGVWRADSPERRGYFWSLPVDRRGHTLFRAGMGWVVLMGVCVLAMALALVTIAPSAIRFEGVQLDFTGAWEPLATATLGYVMMSGLSIFFESPLRWMVLAWLGVLGLYAVGTATDLDGLEDGVEEAVASLFAAFSGPLIAEEEFDGGWARHYLIWLALAAAGLIAAALWRHEEK